ncbi:hypothetical protein TWF730_008005 [Orbilia blumenaviensis]|uniref:Uncharacterized protein n=1 Tax=Orbilia blumenaviensis TaxID=1796055 RepID=A0AAV9VB96_9PEZI
MRSIALALPLLFLTADLVTAKFDWGRPWKNSGLDIWPAFVEETGKHTGYYQLDCSRARNRVNEKPVGGEPFLGGPNDPNKDPWSTIEDCENYCRCNMFGELLLNPIAGMPCNDDIFLRKCVGSQNPGAFECSCKWIQKQPSDKLSIKATWKDVPEYWPGSEGSPPGERQHNTPNDGTPNYSSGGWNIPLYSPSDLRKNK